MLTNGRRLERSLSRNYRSHSKESREKERFMLTRRSQLSEKWNRRSSSQVPTNSLPQGASLKMTQAMESE